MKTKWHEFKGNNVVLTGTDSVLLWGGRTQMATYHNYARCQRLRIILTRGKRGRFGKSVFWPLKALQEELGGWPYHYRSVSQYVCETVSTGVHLGNCLH